MSAASQVESEIQPPNASFRDWIAVISTMLGAFMAILDIQITNASLANIEGAVGASSSEGSWISTAYLIAEIIVIPLSGWLSKVVGLKRYLMVHAAAFVAFSVACALSQSLTQLILFRAGQGFAGGVLIPVALTVLRGRLPRHQVPAGIALFGFSLTFAPAIGPTLGGWLTDAFSWHYLFYLNVAPGLLCIALLWVALDASPSHWEELGHGDWLGIAMMAVGLSSITVVLEEGQRLDWFGSDLICFLSVTAVLGTGGFVARQLLAKDPFINLRLLGNRTVGLSCFIVTVLGGVSLGSVYIIPLYCGGIQHYNPEQIGWVVMWAGLPQLAMYPIIPYLMRHVDPRLLIVFGTLVFAGSCFTNTHLTSDVGMSQLILPQILRGIGQPLFSGPLSQLATGGLTREETPHVSSMFVMLRNLGGSICISVISTIVDRREQFHFSAISERVTGNAVATQQRIDLLAAARPGVGAELAHHQALAVIAGQVRQQATVMSFSDAFGIIGTAMLICCLTVGFLKRPTRRTV